MPCIVRLYHNNQLMASLSPQYKSLYRTISIALTSAAGIAIIGLQFKPEGWLLLGAAFGSLYFTDKKFSKDFLLLNISLIFLGLLDISTNISYAHMAMSGVWISLAVAVPYCVSRYIFRDNKIRFSFGSIKSWTKTHYAYLLLALVLSYLLVPFYLSSTGAYHNWPAENDASSLVRLFFGTNALGIWDELYFVIVVLGILKHYLKFWQANIIQSVLWTSFLFELGFTGWGPVLIFLFALLQGWVFQKTHSLLYTLAIHLSLDLVLYLAIVNAHHPSMFNIFIT